MIKVTPLIHLIAIAIAIIIIITVDLFCMQDHDGSGMPLVQVEQFDKTTFSTSYN